jgi:cytochrome bd-type quinol oxidase subunit 1
MAIKDDQHYNRVNSSVKKILVNNFIGGIAWGLGVTIGLAVVFTILGFIGTSIDLIPVVGTFVSDLIEYILSNNPRLR